MKKKFITLMLTLCMILPCAFFFVACGETPPADPPPDVPPMEYDITVNWVGFSDDWLSMYQYSCDGRTVLQAYMIRFDMPKYTKVDNLKIKNGETELPFEVTSDNGSTWLSLADFIASNFNYDDENAEVDVVCALTNITANTTITVDITACQPVSRQLQEANFYFDTNEQTWTGSEITTYCGTSMYNENIDYSVSYTNNIDPGEATITVTGLGAFADSTPIVKHFDIVRYFEWNDFEIEENTTNDAFLLASNEENNKRSVKCNVAGLVLDEHYIVEYPTSIDYTTAGTKTMKVLGASKYYKASFDIIIEYYLCNQITEADFDNISSLEQDVIYSGSTYFKNKEPQSSTLNYEAYNYVVNPDQLENVTDSQNPVRITITGQCNPSMDTYYMGSFDVTFHILPCNINTLNGGTPMLEDRAFDLDTNIISNNEWAEFGSYGVHGEMVLGTDYRVTSGSRPANDSDIEVGVHSITFEGIGNYSGEVTLYFDITQDISKAFTTDRNIGNQAYTGSEVNVDSIVATKLKATHSSLVLDDDYGIAYDNNWYYRGTEVVVTVSGLYFEYNTYPNTSFYTGSFDFNSYYIVDVDLSMDDFTDADSVSGSNKLFTDSAITPDLGYYYDGINNNTIKEYFDVVYSNNRYVNGYDGTDLNGDYIPTITITPKASEVTSHKYASDVSLVINFNIVPAGVYFSYLTNTFENATFGGDLQHQEVSIINSNEPTLQMKYLDIIYTYSNSENPTPISSVLEPTSLDDPTLVTLTIRGKYCLEGEATYTYLLYPEETATAVRIPTARNGVIFNAKSQYITWHNDASDAPYTVVEEFSGYHSKYYDGGSHDVKFVLKNEEGQDPIYTWADGTTEDKVITGFIGQATNSWASTWASVDLSNIEANIYDLYVPNTSYRDNITTLQPLYGNAVFRYYTYDGNTYTEITATVDPEMSAKERVYEAYMAVKDTTGYYIYVDATVEENSSYTRLYMDKHPVRVVDSSIDTHIRDILFYKDLVFDDSFTDLLYDRGIIFEMNGDEIVKDYHDYEITLRHYNDVPRDDVLDRVKFTDFVDVVGPNGSLGSIEFPLDIQPGVENYATIKYIEYSAENPSTSWTKQCKLPFIALSDLSGLEYIGATYSGSYLISGEVNTNPFEDAVITYIVKIGNKEYVYKKAVTVDMFEDKDGNPMDNTINSAETKIYYFKDSISKGFLDDYSIEVYFFTIPSSPFEVNIQNTVFRVGEFTDYETLITNLLVTEFYSIGNTGYTHTIKANLQMSELDMDASDAITDFSIPGKYKVAYVRKGVHKVDYIYIYDPAISNIHYALQEDGYTIPSFTKGGDISAFVNDHIVGRRFKLVYFEPSQNLENYEFVTVTIDMVDYSCFDTNQVGCQNIILNLKTPFAHELSINVVEA